MLYRNFDWIVYLTLTLQSDRGSTHSNLSEPLHSLSKQQLAWSDHGRVWRGSNESNPKQTTLSAACSDFAQLRRSSNESNHAQTTLTAACSGCAVVWRGSNESKVRMSRTPLRLLFLLLAQTLHRFGDVRMSRTTIRPR